MENESILEELLDLAEKIGMEVRRASLSGQGGGLCVLRGRRILVVDVGLPPTDQVAQTAGALAGLPELEEMYLKPALRETLEANRQD